jgi:hypothetical protein
MYKHLKVTFLMVVVASLVLFAGLKQATADTLLFGFGLPTANLNGYPGSSYLDRSNGTPASSSYTSIPTTNYSIEGDKFSIGSAGQQYQIDKISVWMSYGSNDINGVPTSQYSTSTIPTDHILSLSLYFGPDGGTIVKTNSTYTYSRVYYTDGQNYQRLSDGSWRGLYQIDFTTNITINGGQQYDYFLGGWMQFNTQNGPNYTVPGLQAAYQPNSGVTPVGGSLDNTFYWYVVGTGAVSSASSFLPQGHYADANVGIYGSEVPLPGAVWLLGSGLLGLGGWRRRRG